MDTQTDVRSVIASLIDDWCGFSEFRPRRGAPHYCSKLNAIHLSKHGGPLGSPGDAADATRLFTQILEQFAESDAATGRNPASDATWTLQKETCFRADSTSLQTILEILVVSLLGDQWSNQVPTPSDLVPGTARNPAIDLVHDCGNGEFEFIELKYGTAEQCYGPLHPFHAAWNIVLFGLLYAHDRLHWPPADSRPLLAAKKIRLVVLAPEGYYSHRQHGGYEGAAYQLAWLEGAINKGLASLPLDGVAFDFGFQKFTTDFDAVYAKPQLLPVALQAFRQAALSGRKRVY